MTDAHLLGGGDAETLYARLASTFTALTGLRAPEARPAWLLEILLQAYPGAEAETVMERIESLDGDHGNDILLVIEDHSPGAPGYLEARDRLYACPEVLLVADLARHYPARLRAVAGPSDYAGLLEPMASELNGR